MVRYKIAVARDFEADAAEVKASGRSLTDRALMEIVGRDISKALGKDETLTFSPGYRKSSARYYLTAEINGHGFEASSSMSWKQKLDIIDSLRNRLLKMTDEVNRPRVKAAYEKAEAKRGLLSRIFATRDDLELQKRQSIVDGSTFTCEVTDVDLDGRFERVSRFEHMAQTEWKQSGAGLAGYPPAAIIDLIEEQVGRLVVLRTGAFEWHERHIFDPKGSSIQSDDYDIPSFAFGELDQDGCFLPIKCHITWHQSRKLMEAAMNGSDINDVSMAVR